MAQKVWRQRDIYEWNVTEMGMWMSAVLPLSQPLVGGKCHLVLTMDAIFKEDVVARKFNEPRNVKTEYK